MPNRSGRRLGCLDLETGPNVAAFATRGVRSLGTTTIWAKDGVSRLDRKMGATTMGTTGRLSE